MNDTLSTGLTFDGAQNIVVKVGTATLASPADYIVYTGTEAAPYTFRVAFKNIKAYTVGTAITVTYSATVNESAVIGNGGNTNTASLTYSHNPNNSSGGDPSSNPKPDNTIPTGKSTDKITKTYVTELKLTKYGDKVEAGKELANAIFQLTGDIKTTGVTTATNFVESATGNYYKLTDGTYTTEKPQPEVKDAHDNVVMASNENLYESTTVKYALKEVTTYTEITKKVDRTIKTGSDGVITFTGLSEGTYTLTELKAPDGYNTVDPITFTIGCTLPASITTGNETCTWTSNNAAVTVDGTTGKLQTNVVDKEGNTLPSTGGVGTTVFYVLGSVLVVAAGVTLVTRKRLSDR